LILIEIINSILTDAIDQIIKNIWSFFAYTLMTIFSSSYSWSLCRSKVVLARHIRLYIILRN